MENSFLFHVLMSGFVSGLIIFQTALAAPIVFTYLKEDQSRIFIRKVFPRLFMILFIIGFIMLLSNLYFGIKSDFQYWVSIISTIFPLICSLMVNTINRATDSGNQKKFKVLHSISVSLIMIVLLTNLFWPFFIT
tara:strand:- start:879 stop:1283 length:405 start_codon:yes stop_codon:yes gene_type:complete